MVLFSLIIDAQGRFESGDARVVARLYAGGAFPERVTEQPTVKAYKEACKKLPAQAVERFGKLIHDGEYAEVGETFHERKVIVVDGTKISIPATDETKEKYGMGYGHYAQCHAVGFYELSTGTFEHFDFAQIDTAERALAQAHMGANETPTLYLCDAGYTGMGMISVSREAGHDLLTPLKTGMLKEEFRKTRKRSWIYEVKLTKSHLKNYPCHQHLIGQEIKVRLIRTYGTSRMRSQILITTLLDGKEHPWQELCQLYRQRYTIELAFRHLKQRIGIEHVRKRTLNRIEQLLHAGVALYNLSAVIRNRAARAKILPRKTGVRVVCFSYCVEVVNLFVGAALRPYHGMKILLNRQLKAIRNCTFVYVPWRAEPRICHTPPSKFTVQKGAENLAETKKVGLLREELAILKLKYEAMGA